jgi:hypothetical protein
MSPPIALCTLLCIISMLPVQPPLPPKLVQVQSPDTRKLADWLLSAAASLIMADTQLKSREIDSPGKRARLPRRRVEAAVAAWQQQQQQQHQVCQRSVCRQGWHASAATSQCSSPMAHSGRGSSKRSCAKSACVIRACMLVQHLAAEFATAAVAAGHELRCTAYRYRLG